MTKSKVVCIADYRALCPSEDPANGAELTNAVPLLDLLLPELVEGEDYTIEVDGAGVRHIYLAD